MVLELPIGSSVDTIYGVGKITHSGYRYYSPDVNNDVCIIPSNRISMKDVLFPVMGIDNIGNAIIMYPEEDYIFKGEWVIELPIRNGQQKQKNEYSR